MNIEFKRQPDKNLSPRRKKSGNILWLVSLLFLIMTIVNNTNETLWFGLTFATYAISNLLLKYDNQNATCAVGLAGSLLIILWGVNMTQINFPFTDSVRLFCYILADIGIICQFINIKRN